MDHSERTGAALGAAASPAGVRAASASKAETSDRALICPACCRPTIQRFLYAKNGCHILRCTQCGLGRADASGFDPESYYTADYFSGGHADGYADYLGAEAILRREFAGTVDFIRKFRPSGRLLDVGCAYGFFLQEARRHYDVSGIELAEDAAEHCRRTGLRVRSGVADEANLAQLGAMDVIVLLDVIEHLPSPAETLALCARHLNPGGILVITTGDFGSPAARLAGSRWRLMTPPQHLWFFSRESIRRMTQPLGLEFAHFDHPWKLVPLSLITFQLRRMAGLRPRPGASAAPGTLGVPVNLFDAMRVVLRKRPS
jgi:2-polyprenyl-3-methyl-5-hydroxy-6-metoxy-1,4-benzoquinol methylase